LAAPSVTATAARATASRRRRRRRTMERVDALALHMTKLAHATGVAAPEAHAPAALDGVTCDLDVEALTKAVLDDAQDLDRFLRGLLAARRPAADALRHVRPRVPPRAAARPACERASSLTRPSAFRALRRRRSPRSRRTSPQSRR
jgi:hypothetical protein